ncbi:MAG: hypothetical protein RL018_999 [Pseudomonadota bacterium]|jgi:uncharacterized DUF497 family protein
MEIEFDPAKNARNIELRGLSFTLVEALDWSTAIILEDLRRDYGERRFRVFGLIGTSLHTMIFTPRGEKIRVISLRKSNLAERKRYEHQTKR